MANKYKREASKKVEEMRREFDRVPKTLHFFHIQKIYGSLTLTSVGSTGRKKKEWSTDIC